MDPIDRLVDTRKGIESNIRTLNRFAEGSSEEKSFYRRRIKNGKNFVALHTEQGLIFSPSKFAGYHENDLKHTDRIRIRDGRLTDVRISVLIGKPIEKGQLGYNDIDRLFESYCSAHNITPSKHPRARRYWIL